MGVILLAVAALVGLLLLAQLLRAADFIRDEGWHHIIGRLLTGDHLDGSQRTNKTWTHHGTRPAKGRMDAHLSWWARRARLHRLGYVWAGILLAIVTGWGYLTHRAATVTAWHWAAILLACTLAGITARRYAMRGHRNHVVNPIATGLAGHIGLARSVIAASLRVTTHAEDCQPGDLIMSFGNLPDSYAAQAADRQWVEEFLRGRFPVPLRFHWELHTHPMSLTVLCAAAPPLAVPLPHWLNRLDQLRPGQYFLGVAAENAEQIWDATEQDPDMAVGARTRKGKTNVNLGIAAQGLRRGEQVTAIDPKRVSLACLRGVPGFVLANDPGNVPAMWAAIADFRHAMDEAIAGRGDGRVHLLILEEINQLFALFRDYWEGIKERDQLITNVPAWVNVRAVLHQGAQFGFYVLVDGQDLDARSLFGARHCFGTILLTGYTENQWRNVAPRPVPPSPERKGRFYRVHGQTPTLLQVIVGDPRGDHHNEQAWREFALNGRAAQEEARTWAWTERLAGHLPQLGWRRQERHALSRVLIGPKDAAAYLGMTTDQFKMLRRRTPIPGEFTTPRRGQEWACWTKESLELWLEQVQAGAGRG
jgi:hypothetical protein